MPVRTINAEPAAVAVDTGRTALVIIDMQRDFLEPGGFGAALGNDVARLRAAVEPCRAVLSDCCASYFPDFHQAGLAMIKAQGGIFGWVAASPALLNVLAAHS